LRYNNETSAPEMTTKNYNANLRKLGGFDIEKLPTPDWGSSNPMGRSAPSLEKTPVPAWRGALALGAIPKAKSVGSLAIGGMLNSRTGSRPGSGARPGSKSVGAPPTQSVGSLAIGLPRSPLGSPTNPRSPLGSPPRSRPGSAVKVKSEWPEFNVEVTVSSSVPTLPTVGFADSPGGSRASSRPATTPAASKEGSIELGDTMLSRPTTSYDSPKKKTVNANDRKTKVTNAFCRAVKGKSILVLSEHMDIRKTIVASLRPAEVDLCFAKTAQDMWHHLQNRHDTYSAILWDLTTLEGPVDSLLRQIREHKRYGSVPIVVLCTSHELPEIVQIACSYVVFHPLQAAMLREALLWCLDRKSLVGQLKKDASEAEAQDPFVLFGRPGTGESAQVGNPSAGLSSSDLAEAASKALGQ